MKCFYFGCWNRAGHYLNLPGGQSAHERAHVLVEYYGHRVHIDGTLAPRKNTRHSRGDFGALCWQGQGITPEERSRIGYDSEEYPQGQFLLHVLDNGYTAIQWWDRCQGDTRGACNSTILLEGTHTADEMVAALHEHFPSVLENLRKGGVSLVEVKR
jgi:hypothetical protein